MEQTINNKTTPVCVGTGLVALDVVISSIDNAPAQFLAGGSCGNVLTILSYFGWESYPIARLSNNVAGEVLLEDLHRWNVKDSLISFTNDGSTPVIIHRILKDINGAPKHKFEFRNPENGSYLPSYKPCLAKAVPEHILKVSKPNVFYFDRINRGAIDLAKAYKKNGAIIFFEPSSMKDIKGFTQSVEISDVIKFSHDRITDYESLFEVATAALEIQTLGNQGLKFRTKGMREWISVSGFSIEDVIDSAGAGDWCTAGIISKLFSKSIADWKQSDITLALQYGQVLSALNCTFEGARGLMYNVSRNELVLFAEHILSAQLKKIPQKSRPVIQSQVNTKINDITSLFATI